MNGIKDLDTFELLAISMMTIAPTRIVRRPEKLSVSGCC